MRTTRIAIAFVLFLALALPTGNAGAAISITKAVLVDQDQGTEVAYGFADEALNVSFRGDGTCDCGCPNLSFTWHFGDGTSAAGKTASHNYAGGAFYPSFEVACTGCGDDQTSESLAVYALSGVEVTLIGEADGLDWLCFNVHVTCEAQALPAGIWGSQLIDWSLLVFGHEIEKPNQSSTSMTLPEGHWPARNSGWGPGQTLYCSIDGPHVAGQQDELVTGAASYLSDPVPVSEFYDGRDDANENPSPYPNWFYYYKDSSANHGTPYWHDAWSQIKYESGAWHAYLGPADNNAYTPPEGDNGGNEIEYIDDFAWTARHEGRHVTTSTSWWPNNYTGIGDDDEGTGDWMPDSQEPALGGTALNPINGGPFDPAKINTDGDGTGRDDEDYTCNTQAAWTEGGADDEDWAHPGKQWE